MKHSLVWPRALGSKSKGKCRKKPTVETAVVFGPEQTKDRRQKTTLHTSEMCLGQSTVSPSCLGTSE
jgi:hypothetical protein